MCGNKKNVELLVNKVEYLFQGVLYYSVLTW